MAPPAGLRAATRARAGDAARVVRWYQPYSEVYRECRAATTYRARDAKLDPADAHELGYGARAPARLKPARSSNAAG